MKVTDFGHSVLNIEGIWSIELPSEDFAGTSIYTTLKLTFSPEDYHLLSLKASRL